jgi:hypothetical protein
MIARCTASMIAVVACGGSVTTERSSPIAFRPSTNGDLCNARPQLRPNVPSEYSVAPARFVGRTVDALNKRIKRCVRLATQPSKPLYGHSSVKSMARAHIDSRIGKRPRSLNAQMLPQESRKASDRKRCCSYFSDGRKPACLVSCSLL